MHVIEQIVLQEIQKCCQLAQDDENALVTLIRKKFNAQDETERRQKERELSDAQNRLTSIDRIIEQLYEDRVAGALPMERFTQMLSRYEEEQHDLRHKCDALHATLASVREETENADRFLRLVRSITRPAELTSELVGQLIERVEIGETYVTDGGKKQDIRILFNFIGEIG